MMTSSSSQPGLCDLGVCPSSILGWERSYLGSHSLGQFHLTLSIARYLICFLDYCLCWRPESRKDLIGQPCPAWGYLFCWLLILPTLSFSRKLFQFSSICTVMKDTKLCALRASAFLPNNCLLSFYYRLLEFQHKRKSTASWLRSGIEMYSEQSHHLERPLRERHRTRYDWLW